MAEPVSHRHKQAVVGDAFVLERAPHLKAQASANDHKRDVFQGMTVSLSEFIGPNNRRVVEKRAVAVGLFGLGQSLGEVGDLLAVPVVDLR